MSAQNARWAPNPQGLQQVLKLLTDSLEGNNETQSKVFKQLDQLKTNAEFNNYLCLVLTMKDQNVNVRHQAGLTLKNNFSAAMPAEARAYIKSQVLSVMGDDMPTIRGTVASIVVSIAQAENLAAWPTLLPDLVKCLDSPNPLLVEGAMNTLSKICEDMHQHLDSEQLGRPLNVLIPKLISLFPSPNPSIRRYALGSVNCFLFLMPQALVANMNKYMEGLFALTKDPSKEIRKRVCQAFVILLEVRFEHLAPHMDGVIKFMLTCTQDDDELVALEACEFWSAYCETKTADKGLLRNYLKMLVPVLLAAMKYSEFDAMILRGEDEDDTVPDRPEDIRPHFHKSKTQNYNYEDLDEDGDDEDLDDDAVSDWNLRKCAAASLDTLSRVYKNDLLAILLPVLQVNLSNRDSWFVRESGILALGAVAEGCYADIENYLKDLVPYLIQLLRDAEPLVRSITCWTLSRYSKWVIHEHNDDEKYFRPLMTGLLQRILDSNKRVQEAACSAFATFEEEAQERLLPYVTGILQNLMYAFGRYQAKNMLILYDTIGTLAEAVGSDLNKAEHVQVLMPPLMTKWNALRNDDRNIFPLLECLTSVAQALGMGFAPYAQPVFARCLQIIEQTLIAQQQYNAAPNKNDLEAPDKEFIMCALDLLSGLAEGLEGNIESLVGKSNLLPLLFECVKDSDPDVRQSAFALLGDLAKTCIGHLHPHIDKFIPMATKSLNPEHTSVCNNASWAIGEIALKLGDDIKQAIPMIMHHLIPILNNSDLVVSLLENTAVTMGRLAIANAQIVAQQLDKFAKPWCVFLGRLRENAEKEHAFKGLCATILINPKAMLPAFPQLCSAFASWTTPSEDLAKRFHQILHSYKNMLGGSWNEALSHVRPEVMTKLQTLYKI